MRHDASPNLGGHIPPSRAPHHHRAKACDLAMNLCSQSDYTKIFLFFTGVQSYNLMASNGIQWPPIQLGIKSASSAWQRFKARLVVGIYVFRTDVVNEFHSTQK